MAGKSVLGLLAAALLLSSGPIRADVLTCWKAKCCPPPSYSHCHYWTPELYRAWACLFGPKISQEAVFRYPELPLTIENHPYPCPPVPPNEYYSPYLLPAPGSTYERPKAPKAADEAGKSSTASALSYEAW